MLSRSALRILSRNDDAFLRVLEGAGVAGPPRSAASGARSSLAPLGRAMVAAIRGTKYGRLRAARCDRAPCRRMPLPDASPVAGSSQALLQHPGLSA